jgi:hypothetical protein
MLLSPQLCGVDATACVQYLFDAGPAGVVWCLSRMPAPLLWHMHITHMLSAVCWGCCRQLVLPVCGEDHLSLVLCDALRVALGECAWCAGPGAVLGPFSGPSMSFSFSLVVGAHTYLYGL